MADLENAAKRATGLKKLFNAIIHGHRQIKTAGDSDRFLEAICMEEDISKCVECLIASPAGLSSVAKSFRFSQDSAFLNGQATSLLHRLSDTSVKQLYGGRFLHRVLEQILQPPTFWNTFTQAHDSGTLSPQGTQAFAWLLLESLYIRPEIASDVRAEAEKVCKSEVLIKSDSLEIRNIGYKIKHILESTSENIADGPGGRHDNDFADYRKVQLLPTPYEFASTETPFYRRADAIAVAPVETRGLIHLDNQFRLLREDLLGELRNDFQIATGQKRGRRKLTLSDLHLVGMDCGTESRRKHCALKFRCMKDIPQLQHMKGAASRRTYISSNRGFLKHQSLGCLISDGNMVAFATIDRDEALLSESPPTLILRPADAGSFRKVLITCKMKADLSFVLVDTPVFAYEPTLNRLQAMHELPLEEQLLNLEPESAETCSGIQPQRIIDAIRLRPGSVLQELTGASRPVDLDESQLQSLLAGLEKKLSLIQGLPGTGKSFIGALIAKILHRHTNETILTITYTNHALNQYLMDIQKAGIPASAIVRLGSKFDANTEALSLSKQPSDYKSSGQTRKMIYEQKLQAEDYLEALSSKMAQFTRTHTTEQALLDYLEFSDESDYFDAFVVPDDRDGMTLIGKKNKKVDKYYLIERWCQGKNAGLFEDKVRHQSAWNVEPQARAGLRMRWLREIANEEVGEISALAGWYNDCRDEIESLYREKDSHILRQKRIIGCTTTAAAKYIEAIQKAKPGIILVEEAGEILESHVLAALTSTTKQVVLIGDHKQLRPKVNNYALTEEKGEGFNLNVSLFERLVVGGVPHITLKKQHRMRPEISTLVRSLTYPELKDAESTYARPQLRGFQDNIIFVSHSEREVNADRIADRRDGGSGSSKENMFEADIILKCIRYLGQQGYKTDDIVVLTPYLGQLYLLVNRLAKDTDPVLNDLDHHELTRAGLLSPAGAKMSKSKIRISTIDNYQGEESDIVIASLTRSNGSGDIGFMAAPQRVNVLLSRARNALIMVGNPETFMASRKGKDVWVPLMNQLKKNHHVYSGFPVKCEQHPDKIATLVTKEDFDLICPDGGCSAPCGAMLRCGVHRCPSLCHQLKDHSQMQCKVLVKSKCSKSHEINRRCHDIAATTCRRCEAEAKLEAKKRQRDYDLDQEREAKRQAYATQLAEIEDEIEHQKRVLKDQGDETDRQNALSQKQQDLLNLRKLSKSNTRHQAPIASGLTSTSKSSTKSFSGIETTPQTCAASPGDENSNMADTSAGSEETKGHDSGARDEWEWQKNFQGAENEALDSLMSMIGLESVKEKFLSIKAKVDTVVRQNVSLKGERFGAALLGNPGTGKTTVARTYAKFLVKVGALPGDYFFETSGSALANDGVPACKKHIDNILNGGGGVFFIDEAYQLVSGNSFGGKAVLDYLLAEIENLTGKVVFVLAGYHKQMEAFFAHNPGIPSRIPIQMEFQDYTDQELQRIFVQYIDKKYNCRMKIEDGMSGLFARIVARRLGRGRGREGFGNARDVQNKISEIAERQAKRLSKQRRAGRLPDDNIMTKEDLIGPEPSLVLKGNKTWMKLQKLIGLASVKQSIQSLIDGIQFNYQRELQEKPIVQYSLNRCFIGSPGTGKTSVAKLYGQILADIGMLSNGEVVVKNPADFIGNVLGGSEANTKAILASSIGKVLIIDEAYMLATQINGKTDPFKAAVIDTIVAEVQSTPGEDRCVLLLGYKDQMEEMLRDVNPGLARRFPLESAFVFEDFNDAEMCRILELKLKDVGFEATDQAKKVAMEAIQRARNRPNFGNAGEVDIILDKAKALHQKHLTAGKVKNFDTFEAIDFDPEFDRVERAATNLPALFQDVVGCEDLIKKFQGYQRTAANLKSLGMDPREQLPFNFLFKGPPGTGKTTTAQKMGKVFYDMGLLSQAKVEECSATDLIGEYVGHTGPKVQKQLEKAMGKVLFIDEAYRLGEGRFAKEAMDELVDCITKPKYAKKLIIILAGYDKQIDQLMSVNPGLTSRFPESVIFKHLEPETCLELLTKTLLLKTTKAPLDISALISASIEMHDRIRELFGKLSALSSWGNARDVVSLAHDIINTLVSKEMEPGIGLVLTEDIITGTMEAMLDERSRREAAVSSKQGFGFNTSSSLIQQQQQEQQQQDSHSMPPLKFNTSTETSTQPQDNKAAPPQPKAAPPDQDKKEKHPPTPAETQPPSPLSPLLSHPRDPSVSDATWTQLTLDKHAQLAREASFQRLRAAQLAAQQHLEALRRAEQDAADEEARRLVEQQRRAAEEEERRRVEEVQRVQREREAERKALERVQRMGRCLAGFCWIRQSGGWRCAGGSHWVGEGEVGL